MNLRKVISSASLPNANHLCLILNALRTLAKLRCKFNRKSLTLVLNF